MSYTKLGINCGFYINTTPFPATLAPGTLPAATWVGVGCVSDFSQKAGWDKGDVQTRRSRVKMAVKTLLDLSWAGKLKASDSDDEYLLIVDAMDGDTVLDVMILNGGIAENGSFGYRLTVQVFSLNEDQGPGAVLMDEFELYPTPTDMAPQGVNVVGGVPTFVELHTNNPDAGE